MNHIRENEDIDVEGLTQYWLMEAEEALKVADHLIEKSDFSYALFFGHLAIEKILKSLHVALKKEHAPPIHQLVRLAKMAGVALDEQTTNLLITITGFNIEARYPDIKRSFRDKCTATYTYSRIKEIKEIYRWLKSQLP